MRNATRPARTRPVRAGHTLVELLVTLALAATVAGLAAPTFRELGADVRRDARVDQLRGTLLLARSEAVARGVPVVVCASSDGRTCRGDEAWSDGWVAYADAAAPTLLRTVTGDARTRVRANRAAVEFEPTALAATTATLTVCDVRGGRAPRALVVSRTGRVRVERPAEPRCD